MKKRSILVVFVLLYGITSCSSDDNEEIIDDPINDVTYTNAVKVIIDTNCISCHGDPIINGAPMPLLTLEDVKEAVQNRNLIGRIEDGSMPPDNAPELTADQIQSVKDWEIGNFQE